jgi:hypothetical protein
MYFGNRLNRILMDKAGDGKGGGGSGRGKKDDDDTDDESDDDGGDDPDPRDEVIRRLEARLEKLEAGRKKKRVETEVDEEDDEDEDLNSKAKKDRELKEQKTRDSKALESALKFSLGAKDWLKTNGSLLPKDIEGIFAAAEKETYADALEKDAAIKTGIIQSFFSIQSNMDLLTAGPKSSIEEYLKLTKNGKQEKAQAIYDTVFEPAFEMLKRIKKAEQLSKGGQANSTDGEKAYADRLMKLSKKHYLGEKADA